MAFGTLLLIILILAVMGVLFLGIVSMIRGGEFNRKYGNKLMVARVVLQGLAIATLLALAFCSGNHG